MRLFSNLKGDISGGISAGVVALPVALAFGAAAGLNPVNGLYGAIFLGLIAAIFGGTQTLISNPTGPMTVVSAFIVTNQIASHNGSAIQAMPAIFMIFFLAGAVQIVLGLLKLGKYVSYIPYPVISGFMSGIGVIIIILQFSDFFGNHGKFDVIESVMNLPQFIQNANWLNVTFAALTVTIIYFFPRVTKAVPSTLVALILLTLACYIFKIDIVLIGDKAKIPSGAPSFNFAMFTQLEIKDLGKYILPAVSLGALGMVDSLLTSVVADNLTKTKHKSNLELIGQGVGNMVSSMFGGIPGAGTTPATVLNINSGARTQLSGIIHALFLLVILLFGASIAEMIPLAVLSGILVTVGVSVLDRNVLKDVKYVPKIDNFIMVTVLLITVFYDLLFAVAVGLIIAALHFMKKMADVVERESRNKRIDRILRNIIDSFENKEEFNKNVEIIALNGPLFFGFASRFQDKIDLLPEVKAVVFDFSQVHHLDQSGAYTFKEACLSLKRKGVNVCVCEMHWRQLAMFKGIRLTPEIIDEKHIFDNIEDALLWLNEPGHLDNNFNYDDQLYVPSVFTPNGDGIGDTWEIRNIDKFPDCKIIVYTRTNIILYEGTGKNFVPWDGLNMRGKVTPDGQYTYEIDLYGDGKEVKIGSVSIFR